MSAPSLQDRVGRALTQRLRLTVEGGERIDRLAHDLSASVVSDRHGSRDYYLRRVLAVSDALALASGLLVASLASNSVHFASHGAWALATIPGWLILLNLYGLYNHDARRASHSGVDELPGIFHAMLIGAYAMWLYFQAVPTQKVEFLPMLVFAASTGLAMMLLRALSRAVTARLLGPERVLFVGSGPSTSLLIRRMHSHASYGLEPVGLVADKASTALPRDVPVVGELERTDVAQTISNLRIDRVVVEAGGFADEAILGLLRRCKQLSVKVSLLPAAFGVLGSSVTVDHVGGVTLLGVNPPVLPRSSRAMKRAMDIGGALILLSVFAPVLFLVALAVKVDSRGPVFFRQRRVGRNGRSFYIFKFRTMVGDAEDRLRELLPLSKDPDWLLLDDDPRITRVGGWLRASSLDEVPQLLNVLAGHMSLVGPRPLVPDESERIDEWARHRIDLTPGTRVRRRECRPMRPDRSSSRWPVRSRGRQAGPDFGADVARAGRPPVGRPRCPRARADG